MSNVEFVQSKDVKLAVRVDGPETAPWLVLSNSLGSNHTMWDGQIAGLIKHFRVLRYDTRGHGSSGAPEGPYNFNQLTEDVLALMNEYSIESTKFMGLSLGGMTGLGLAITYPERIEKLVVADARANAPAEVLEMWDLRIEKIREGGLDAIVDTSIDMWITEESKNSDSELVQRIRDMILGNDREGYISTCYALKKLSYLENLNSIKCPVLYIGGDEDKSANPETMKHMAENTPDAIHEIIYGARHLSNLDKPVEFNSSVLSFLTS